MAYSLTQGCIFCKGSPGKWGGEKNKNFDLAGQKNEFQLSGAKLDFFEGEYNITFKGGR